ncbi:MAG: cohesin domain-containing protein [Minisyncoccota bacterium]
MTRTTLITAALGVLLAFPSLASAATISLSPTSINVHPGQTFTVTVTAVPAAGEKLYTVKADLGFDPTIVQVTSFSFASGWMPLTQKGYDTTDNTGGELMKTGGYPGGVTSTTVLGTATFTAKAAGTVTVTTTGKSLALDQASKNALTGAQGTTRVMISAPTPTPTLVKTTTTVKPATTSAAKPVVKSVTKTKVAKQASATSSAVAEVASTTATSTAALAAAAASGSSSSSMTYAWLMILALAIIGGWVWYRRQAN